jgi:bacteriocin-like protein
MTKQVIKELPQKAEKQIPSDKKNKSAEINEKDLDQVVGGVSRPPAMDGA